MDLPHFSPLLQSPVMGREDEGEKFLNNLLLDPWGVVPESPPIPRKELNSPKTNKLYGNWVQDKDGKMISYWDSHGSSSLVFSPLMQPSNVHSHQQAQQVPTTLQDQALDEDIGTNDELPILDFMFDDNDDEEDHITTKATSATTNQLYSSNKSSLVNRLHHEGYPVGLCIQAVERFGSNTASALHWLSNNSISINPALSHSSNNWDFSSKHSIPSAPLSSSSSSISSLSVYNNNNEDGPNEYFTYTSNVKNKTSIVPAPITNTSPVNNFNNSLSSLNTINLLNSLNPINSLNPFNSLNNSGTFTPLSAVESSFNPLPIDFYDLSKKVSCILPRLI